MSRYFKLLHIEASNQRAYLRPATSLGIKATSRKLRIVLNGDVSIQGSSLDICRDSFGQGGLDLVVFPTLLKRPQIDALDIEQHKRDPRLRCSDGLIGDRENQNMPLTGDEKNTYWPARLKVGVLTRGLQAEGR